MYDHRKVGRELGLFDSDPLIGAGLPYWLPAGAAVRRALESYIAEVERRAGYQQVYSPVLAKKELYEISGHTGRSTTTTCTRRWRWAVRNSSCGRASARTTP